jgi:hypothetical protein
MKSRIFSMMAVLLVLAGCAKEAAPEVSSEFLVIKADCAAMTKTEISQGNSAWEAGDKITVVYEGAAYEYVAASAGETTTFTSTAGITGYDTSKPIVAYYPATDASGTVKIDAEKTVEFSGSGQNVKAYAPLVGVPQEGNLKDGSLNMAFDNIFSVIELRIDGGDLTGTAKSLTIEPADASDLQVTLQ